MRRRQAVGFAAIAAFALCGHTPYGQWTAYRKKHLLIGCHKGDLDGYAAAKAIVAHLAEHLPDARARVARAPAPSRLASLLATEQLDVALLDHKTISEMRLAEGVFAAYGTIDLTSLVRIDRWFLVSRRDFPERHGWLVAAGLDDYADASAPETIPVHTGAAAYYEGLPEPA